MRRVNSPLVIAIVGLAISAGTLIDTARAAEKTAFSSLVGRLFRIKPRPPIVKSPASSPPVSSTEGPEQRRMPAQVPPPTVQPDMLQQVAPSQTHSGQMPQAASPGAERVVERSYTDAGEPAGRSAEARPAAAHPPLPPRVDQAWVHPPQPQHGRAYTTAEVLATMRRSDSTRSSRRVVEPLASPASSFEESASGSAFSPAFATTGYKAGSIRQVNHVTELEDPLEEKLPRERLPAREMGSRGMGSRGMGSRGMVVGGMDQANLRDEPAIIGNMPAEVVKRGDEPSIAVQEIDEPAITGDLGNTRPAMRAAEAIDQAGSSQPRENRPRSPARMSIRDVDPSLAPAYQKVRGRIAAIDQGTGIVRVELFAHESLPARTKLRVYHASGSGESAAVHLRVVDSVAGVAAARLIDGATPDAIALGDETLGWKAVTVD